MPISASPAASGGASKSPCRNSTFANRLSRFRAAASMAGSRSMAMTRPTTGASRSAASPVPQPKSTATASGGSNPSNASKTNASPKSSRRNSSQSPPIRPKKVRLSTRRAAMTSARRASSSSNEAALPKCSRLMRHRSRMSVASDAGDMRYRLCVPSARLSTQPCSKSGFRWRLTVLCGSCNARASSPTPSSSRSSSRSVRKRARSPSVPSQLSHRSRGLVESGVMQRGGASCEEIQGHYGPSGSAVSLPMAT